MLCCVHDVHLSPPPPPQLSACLSVHNSSCVHECTCWCRTEPAPPCWCTPSEGRTKRHRHTLAGQTCSHWSRRGCWCIYSGSRRGDNHTTSTCTYTLKRHGWTSICGHWSMCVLYWNTLRLLQCWRVAGSYVHTYICTYALICRQWQMSVQIHDLPYCTYIRVYANQCKILCELASVVYVRTYVRIRVSVQKPNA